LIYILLSGKGGAVVIFAYGIGVRVMHCEFLLPFCLKVTVKTGMKEVYYLHYHNGGLDMVNEFYRVGKKSGFSAI
jgi:hypothetical protein